MVDFDDYSDWIELRNLENTPINLDGYFITDDISNPLKWKIPNGSEIASGGFIIIWADDFDESPGYRHSRSYWPWDEFITQNYHTNFKLNKSGEQIGLFKTDGADSSIIIEWKIARS